MTTAPEEAFEYLSSSPSSGDPVTKAVVDNILGNLPTKKEKVMLRCDICNLEFSSQIPLDMHLQGTKHNKKVRSQEILKSLQDEGCVPEEMDMNSLQCDICNIISNSSQQLQMHLKGAKHLSKLKSLGGIQVQTASTAVKRPAPITEEYDEPAAKMTSFSCDDCGIQLNSQTQYQQHMDSPKHKNKVSGNSNRKSWGPAKRGNFQNFKQNRGSQHDYSGMPPLSKSFIMNKKVYTNAYGEETGNCNNMEYGQSNQGYESGDTYYKGSNYRGGGRAGSRGGSRERGGGRGTGRGRGSGRGFGRGSGRGAGTGNARGGGMGHGNGNASFGGSNNRQECAKSSNYDNSIDYYANQRSSFGKQEGHFNSAGRSYNGSGDSYNNLHGSYDSPGGSNDSPRGSYDSPRGTYDSPHGSYDNARGSYDNQRGSYDNQRGSFDNPRGSGDSFNSSRGSYNNLGGPCW